MSFDSSRIQKQTQFAYVNNGFGGMFTYTHSTDDLATILTDGYFPSQTLTGWIAPEKDIIQIVGIDGVVLKTFNSDFHLVDFIQIPQSDPDVITITDSSGNLSENNCYLFNITGVGNYTLPVASNANKGKRIWLKKISLLGACNINNSGGGTLLSLSALNQISVIMSDGANWFVIG